jgi:16S rRNA (guanine527-N7)-methyltransferase
MNSFFKIITNAQLSFNKIIMLKGEKFLDEFNEAKKYFEIKCDMHESTTNPGSKVFVIKSVSKL